MILEHRESDLLLCRMVSVALSIVLVLQVAGMACIVCWK
jgi:hypothetical protein